MKKTPLVTIAIPTLNRSDYLKKTITSVLVQTYKNIEVIISSNGSEDDTPEVVSHYKDARIRYRENTSTVAAPLHFNQCLSEAKGKYFILLSDDDLVSPNYVESHVKCFSQYPSATIGLPHCEIIDENGRIIQSLPDLTWSYRRGVYFILDWLYGKNPIPVPTFISLFSRTDFLKNVGGYPHFTRGLNSENATIIALSLLGDVIYSSNSIFQYRVYLSSYGLNVSYKDLAKSAHEFKQHINADYFLKKQLADKGAKVSCKIIKGVRRMLALQYFDRILNIYSDKLGIMEWIRSLFVYPIDIEYFKLFPWFMFSILRKAFRHK